MRSGLIQDLKYAWRQLRKNPGFTAVAVLILSLGTGANTGIFTLVNAVLLKSLPVPSPEQLFLIRQHDRFADETRVSYPLYDRMLKTMPGSASLAAMTPVGDFYVGIGKSQLQLTKGQLVSGNFFQTFGTFPLVGRLLSAEDNRNIDGHPVAVISYACWNRCFAADPHVVGRELIVNGVSLTVVGVAARNFFGVEPGRAPDFWLPLMMQSPLDYAQHYSKSTAAHQERPWVLQDDITWLELVLRARHRDELGHISGTLNQLFSEDAWEKGVGATTQDGQARFNDQLVVEPGGQGIKTLQRQFARPLLVLTAMVGLVLLIACANLASLLLARGTNRMREMAVRLSIGATRSRLVRQLLTESLLLSILGGLLGIWVAYGCDRVLPKWASRESFPIPLNLAPDARVLLFSIAVVVAAGLLFGSAPAFQGSRIEPINALKASATRASSTQLTRAQWPLRQALVVAQFALSLVLMVGAGLFLRTLRNFVRLDPGFDREHILSVWLDTSIRHYRHDQLLSLYHEVLDRVQALPGVRSASLAVCPLASSCRSASDIYVPGAARVAATPQVNVVSLEYFENTRIPLLRGREFTARDTERAPHVATINQMLARKLFADEDPIGRRFGFDSSSASEFQIIGVVADAQINGPRENAPPLVYFPLLQFVPDVHSLDVRAIANPASLTEQVRQVLKSIDPDLPIGKITTLAEQVSSNLAQERLITRLTTVFGALALIVACIGLYGVTAFAVARRTGEIGIRLALGASRKTVLWLVLRQTLVLIGSGIAAGLFLALSAARSVSSLLFGLSPYDPSTILGAAALLMTVSVAAALTPAWRATKVDPMVALRYE